MRTAGTPLLRSRVWRRQTFTPMARQEVPQIMRAYHQLYHDVDDELLHYVDDKLARGIWRNWALFSTTAGCRTMSNTSTDID